MYGLSEEDLQIQARARGFADELIPFEDEAERADGELPADVTAAHAKRCRELGLHSTNMPRELGGGGCTSLQQVLVQEQMGRVTNALGWVAATPPSWLPSVATRDQIDRYVRPAIAGDREECYAITEEGAGSDVDAIEATARRDGEDYLLNGVKWHVTSYNSADFAFFQAKLPSGDTPCSWSTCPARGSGWSGRRPTRTRSATTTRSWRSPACASRRRTWSARRATGWTSPTSGSGSSG
jgi:alkylation response protein AidB-like acyl-CoA dehydrogenase